MIVMNRMREEIRAIGGRSPNSLAYKEAAKQIEELAQWVKDFLK